MTGNVASASRSALGAVDSGVPSDLVERARNGDHAAFEALYREQVGRVYGLCLRMVADAAVAEELTQAAFVRAWERLASYRGDASFGAWLRTVAANVVISDRRSRLRRAVREVDAVDQDALAAPPTSAAGERLDLERAVASLPAGARAVFVLHDVEGYTHAEVGRLLDVSPITSKTQLHRARRLLRARLES